MSESVGVTDSDNLYGVAAIAKHLGMPEKSCRHRVEKGEIPTFKIGHIRCARRSTLNAWLSEREAAARAPRADS